MEFYFSISIIVILATLFSFLNKLVFKFPSTIGITLIAMLASLLLVFVVDPITGEPLKDMARVLGQIDLSDILMDGMLGFLLFAGAIHIDLSDLREEKFSIMIFSTLSVIISTFVIGIALFFVADLLLPLIGVHLEISLIYCLLFGALISPTDPIAVLSILKEAKVSKSLETKVAGESLFNDGVAVVLFAGILEIAEGQAVDFTFSNVVWMFVREAVGGILIGFALGLLGAYMIKTAKDYKMSVLITLSVVLGGSMIAHFVDVSAPLMMVVAGLIIGESRRRRMKAHKLSNSNLETFWELLDEILNAVLFLIIGFELLLIKDLRAYWETGIICIALVLFARYISIRVPAFLIYFKEKLSLGAVTILVWGGLRGGVSIALALSIDDDPQGYREIIIAITYFVVVFSIVVQGLSIGKLAKKIHV